MHENERFKKFQKSVHLYNHPDQDQEYMFYPKRFLNATPTLIAPIPIPT